MLIKTNRRPAILTFHQPIENIEVGSHPRVSALTSGIFNKRPPQPKYPFIWDVETVSDFLYNLPGNDLLSDKLLTMKASMLLALFSVRDHIFESGLFDKLLIYLYICCSPFDKDFQMGKTRSQSEVSQFPR